MDHIAAMIEAAKAGGQVIRNYFGQTLATEGKSSAADFRTKADVESEQAILAVLNREFNGYNVFAEETGLHSNGSDYIWVIDPMDGTNNFTLGLPNFVVSIGLMKASQIIAGVVYHPILDHTYFASLGKGTYRETSSGVTRMAVSSEKKFTNATVTTIKDYLVPVSDEVSMAAGLHSMNVKRVLRTFVGAFDFCMLANGKVESVVMHGCPAYDWCAGKIICTEAGAVISDFEGQQDKDTNNKFVVSNCWEVHEKVLSIL